MSKQQFEYDVFLSHANADKAAVRELAEQNGEHRTSNGTALRCSAFEVGRSTFNATAFASEWVTLKRHTALFRDAI